MKKRTKGVYKCIKKGGLLIEIIEIYIIDTDKANK